MGKICVSVCMLEYAHEYMVGDNALALYPGLLLLYYPNVGEGVGISNW